MHPYLMSVSHASNVHRGVAVKVDKGEARLWPSCDLFGSALAALDRPNLQLTNRANPGQWANSCFRWINDTCTCMLCSFKDRMQWNLNKTTTHHITPLPTNCCTHIHCLRTTTYTAYNIVQTTVSHIHCLHHTYPAYKLPYHTHTAYKLPYRTYTPYKPPYHCLQTTISHIHCLQTAYKPPYHTSTTYKPPHPTYTANKLPYHSNVYHTYTAYRLPYHTYAAYKPPHHCLQTTISHIHCL